jgi:hypothetical protein
VFQRRAQGRDLGLDHGDAFHEAVDVGERRFDGLLRLLDVLRGAGRDGTHGACGFGNAMVAAQGLRRRLAQRVTDFGLPLHACRDLVDVARDVADLDAEPARLGRNIVDDRPRARGTTKAKTRHRGVSFMVRNGAKQRETARSSACAGRVFFTCLRRAGG